MTPADVRAVRRIERAAYGTRVPGTPFERELANGLAQYVVAVERTPEREPADRASQPSVLGVVRRLGLGAFGLGDESRERIVGFAGVWFTVDQLHLVTIAVDPAQQGRGIGQRLLLEVFALAYASELRSVALEVRATNDRARTLYEAFGFKAAGTLRGYYSDNGEDALVMVTPELASVELRTCVERMRDAHARRYTDAFEPPAASSEPAHGGADAATT